MRTITIEVPDDALPQDGETEGELAREMRLATAILWYQQGRASQGKAAEFAGLSRQAFLEALYEARVPACQATIEEIEEELRRGRPADR
jgi:predicted HTH domain antitoxin